MSEKPVKQPGPNHPITIEPTPERVTVTVAGRVVVDTTRSLTLQEADYPAVQYVPLEDVDRELLEPTGHESYCPFKGEASYYSVPAGGERSENAVWEYRSPHPAMAELEGRVAFYPDRVDSIELSAAAPA
jgi:uncharacterized protein (DUF427 family)